MATLYLIEQNTILRKTGNRILLCKMRSSKQKVSGVRQGEILLELPCADISHVMLFGNIQITTQTLQKLLSNGIELAIFTYNGKLLGQLTPEKPKNIPLRFAQFKHCSDKEWCLAISKSIVKQKLVAMTSILRSYQKNHPDAFSSNDFSSIDGIHSRIHECSNIESLLGMEGAAAAVYFKLFGKMFYPPWQFNKRTRLPPEDAVNSVLSYGYVVLSSEIQAIIDGVGLDPYIGFYHQIHYGRPALALDVLEEFRHAFIDRMTLKMFNLNIFDETNFYKPVKGGIYMNTSGKKKFFIHYQKYMGKYDGAATINEDDIRTIIQNQARKLQNTIMNKTAYSPWDGKIEFK